MPRSPRAAGQPRACAPARAWPRGSSGTAPSRSSRPAAEQSRQPDADDIARDERGLADLLRGEVACERVQEDREPGAVRGSADATPAREDRGGDPGEDVA